MKNMMRTILLNSLCMGICLAATPVRAAEIDPLANIRNQLIAHTPYKQWNLQTGAPNMAIGRTPGAACEAISFFAADMRTSGNSASRAKAIESATWVMQLQARKGVVTGGVPSTPDLPSPSNAFYYAIDAAFCGNAMLDMHAVTGDPRYAQSAHDFGTFILRSVRASRNFRADPLDDKAPCEYVIQAPRRRPEWHCQHYVKNLVALPLLTKLERMNPGKGYGVAANKLRDALVPGLLGLWEYYEPDSDTPGWRRIDGPYAEPNHFIYGDTIAYALAGLTAYEGASGEAQSVYARISKATSRSPSVARYSGRLAWAGYLLADGSPDPLSAYYDTVTLGLLHPVRRFLAPADSIAAGNHIRTHIAPQPRISWSMSMDGKVDQRSTGDISTLAALGKALVE